MQVRVLIAEGNPFVRIGLETILSSESGIDVCGVCGSGAEALGVCQELQPDVLLIDRPLANKVSLPSVHEMCELTGGILVFLDRMHEEEIYEMLSAGVAGFIAKRDDPKTLCMAIRGIAAGDRIWLSPRVSKMLVSPRRRSVERPRLNERERAILRALALGDSNATIAAEHCLSVGTVRNVVSSIYAKIEVKGRTAAVAWAWKNGLIQAGSFGDVGAATTDETAPHEDSKW